MKASEYIAPFCFGYFTQYWFGITGPMPNKLSIIDINNNLQIAFSRKLPCEMEWSDLILKIMMVVFTYIEGKKLRRDYGKALMQSKLSEMKNNSNYMHLE